MRRAALLVLLPAMWLAACGAKSDEQVIRDTIRSSLTTTDPDDCAPGASATAAFVRQYTFGSSSVQRAYEQRCRADISKLAATSVAVQRVTTDGDRASATFKADGGQYPFRRATVALKKDDGRWKLDRINALRLDRAAYDRRLVQLASGVGTLSPRDSGCFLRRLRKVSERTLARAIVASRPGVFADGFLVCFVRPELRKAGLDLNRTRCVVLRLRRRPDRFMRNVFAGTKPAERRLQRTVAGAASSCGGR